GGALDRADAGRVGFRPFLAGVIRNVARQYETRRARSREQPPPTELELAARDDALSRVFDRAWAAEIMRQAAERQAERATAAGPAAVRRVELLRLRFYDGLPIREIAARWQADPAKVHHEYAQAREEFRAALRGVVAFHGPGAP